MQEASPWKYRRVASFTCCIHSPPVDTPKDPHHFGKIELGTSIFALHGVYVRFEELVQRIALLSCPANHHKVPWLERKPFLMPKA
jgi:hypothetical protein